MKYVGAGKNFGGAKITNLGAGTSSTDAVNLAQLNEVRNGKFFKDAIRAVATSNVDIAGGGIANGQTVDGVTLATGDRVLLTAQTTASQNGIYVVPSSGAASRAADMAAGVASAGFNFNITEGTTYHDTRWYVASDKGSDVVGTDSLTIPQDTVGGSYTADNSTLELVGSEFSVKDEGITPTQMATSVAGAGLAGGAGTSLAVQIDDSTLEINGSNDLQVKDAGISAAKLANDAVETAKILDGAVTTGKLADGAVTAAKLAAAVKAHKQLIVGGATSEVITHTRGTRDVRVTLREAASPYAFVEADVEATTTDTITLYFGSAPSSEQYQVCVEPIL